MKKTLLLFTTYLCLGVSAIFAQNVNIPDFNFKNYLLNNPTINTNSDTEISVAEAQAFTGTISATSLGITDLTGIEAFVNITTLEVYSNILTSLICLFKLCFIVCNPLYNIFGRIIDKS